jgi:hypothetical protein
VIINTGYIIYRPRDNRWLPTLPTRRGGTWVEPTDTKQPRIFSSKQNAEQALAWWLKGHAVRHLQIIGKHDGVDDYERVHSEPVEGREASEWEVRPVSLHLEPRE